MTVPSKGELVAALRALVQAQLRDRLRVYTSIEMGEAVAKAEAVIARLPAHYRKVSDR